MLTDLYQEYLYVIGKLKDVHKLTVDVDHKDIHTFYRDQKPLFKLFFGVFQEDSEPTIVVSFHIDLIHADAIQWFIAIYNVHPLIKIHDSYIEDSNGETYLGEDALALQDVYNSQKVLDKWLNSNTKEEIEEFVESKILGRTSEPNKVFDSQKQKSEAIIEFERLRKPGDGEGVH